MKIMIALAVPVLTIISLVAIGFWSKYSEDLENELKRNEKH
ncbi:MULTISPECIES: hypothetical protein [Rossellomorea]|nr:hypothetical protein [Rossellomorea aquimaris]